MSETQYFIEQVLRKRPYLTIELCRAVLAEPLKSERQADGRIRHWGSVGLPSDEKKRILRVVTLADGVTLHNAFIDRNYRENDP
jgi:uncharacterized protein YaeQ